MLHDEIRHALMNHNFEAAESLLQQWGQSVTRSMGGAAGDAERHAIYEEAMAFADNTTHLVRVVRAHIATELKANSTQFLYQVPDLEHHRWRLEA